MQQFTNDWFGPNIPVWDEVLSKYPGTKLLEIGSFEGRSTCYFIERLGENGAIEIHCVDTWAGGMEHDPALMSEVEIRFDKNVTIAKSSSSNPVQIFKHKAESKNALIKLLAEGHSNSFDIAFIDGSHQAADVLTDAILAFQLVRVGGLIVFDDYLWCHEESGKEDLLNMPKLAIDSFLSIFQRKIRILDGVPLYQVFARKVSG